MVSEWHRFMYCASVETVTSKFGMNKSLKIPIGYVPFVDYIIKKCLGNVEFILPYFNYE